MRLRPLLLVTACVTGNLLTSCGDDSPDSHVSAAGDPSVAEALDATAVQYDLDEPTPYLRLDLELSEDGTIEVQHLARITLDREPVAALGLDHVLVGRTADGAVAAAVPVAFTSELHSTQSDFAHHTTTQLPTGHATVYLRETSTIESLSLLKDGVPTWEARAEDLAAQLEQPQRPDRPGGVSPALRATLRELDEKYPSIYFALEGDETAYSPVQLQGGTLVDIDDAMASRIDGALSQLPPAILMSISTLGVGRWPQGSPGFAANTWGSRILLSELDVANLPPSSKALHGLLLHEGTHALTFLSDAATYSQREVEQWPDDVLRAMADLHRRHGIRTSLPAVWNDLHVSGFDFGYTGVYVGEKWQILEDSDAVQSGFATAYGSSALWEDIAEYATAATVLPEGAVCTALASRPTIKPTLAIPYAKLVLLRSLGAITQASLDGCVRGAQLVASDGFSFSDVDAANFSEDLKAGWINDESGASFAVIGSGSDSYRLMVEVALNTPQTSPLGLHRLDDIGFAELTSNANVSGAYLAHKDPIRARSSIGGLVLITRADEQAKEGAVFGLALQNALGLVTDRWAFGTFRTAPPPTKDPGAQR